MIVPRHRLTRRQALKLGAATAALGGLRPTLAGAAAARAEAFTLDLPATGATASAAGWRTTRVFDAPRRFDLIGLGWRRGGDVRAEVRARRHGGGWSRWTALHDAGDHGPDAGRGAAGTDPAWTGAADQFQLRLQGHARGLHARFVRSGPAAQAARRRRGVLGRVAARRQGAAPVIIPRAAWGGDGVPPRSGPAYGQVQLAFVHHTVNANDYAPEESAAIVLGIARYHRDHNGWNDLGYNFVVDQYGQIFEGRAGGIDQAIVGAQAQGFNSVSTGVACLGTYTSVAQTEAGMDALARLIGWKLSLHGIPTSGTVTVTSAGGETNKFAAGTPVTFQRISGHRDGNATSCPGNVLYTQLPDLRVRAGGYTGPVSGLSARASSTTQRGAALTTLSGVLRFPDGSSPVGLPVQLLHKAAGAAVETLLATVTCALDGAWSITLALPRTGTIRARFPGDGTRPALESTAFKVTVVPTLALGLSTRHLRRGRRVAVSGVVVPAPAAARLTLERKVGRRYVRVRRRRLPVRGNRFLRRIRPGRRGLYRVTVSVDGASTRQYLRVT
jgi:hypothetical protein